MAEYKAPLRDIRFVMNEVFEADKLWASLPALQGTVDLETADAILEEASKLVGGMIAPLNRAGDEEGCQWTEGAVTTASGFKEAYQTYAEGGWVGLTGNVELGAMGMPKMLSCQVEEMTMAANFSFGLYPMLTVGASLSINAHASDELKEQYLPNMYAGTWAGSMCLTESHSGTDLGIIRTRAEDNGDGSYSVSGTKIFITGGEHDLTENIIHLVLAKLADAPAGPRGISLFLVPKINVNDDGSLGEANNVSCGSIEHKMGIKASATCVMNFDGAKGYLVGELNKGLACMFTMMNYERLGVGIQGLGAGEASYQNAIEYARDRIQGRSATGAVAPDRAADPILVHADVRRMLLNMKSTTEAGRAFSSYVAKQLDLVKFSEEPEVKHRAEAMVALLTPVAKAFMTDMGLNNTIDGQMVFGGHGYIREWGQEQLVRDARIAQIYEGTNGVQALDLMGRKTVANDGEWTAMLLAEIREAAVAIGGEFSEPLLQSCDRLQATTELVTERAKSNPNEIGAASVEYLHLFGYTAYAYMWLLMTDKAQQKLEAGEGDSEFYRAKIITARYFYQRLLPRTLGLVESIKSGADPLYALADDMF